VFYSPWRRVSPLNMRSSIDQGGMRAYLVDIPAVGFWRAMASSACTRKFGLPAAYGKLSAPSPRAGYPMGVTKSAARRNF
jgi:hypothetical protein